MKADPKLIDAKLVGAGYKFLGWMNYWDMGDEPRPLEFIKCREAKHKTDDVSHSIRGYEHTESCDICKIYWKVDSSD